MTLEEIAARADAATPGPWEFKDTSKKDWYSYEVNGPERFDSNGNDGNFIHRTTHFDDANFIAHARTDIPKLLKIIRAYEKFALLCNCETDTSSLYDEVAAEVTKILEGE